MEKLDIEKLNQIVKSLMFEPTKEVQEQILLIWKDIQDGIKLLDKLDLLNVKPMERINEQPILELLREDIEDMSYSVSKENILDNAKEKDSDFILLTKVVK
ncbi:glutamyl-tRNA amidotransferase [Mycoplasma sp. 2704]|uniref:glutamyl-tRNA amidotransferase n=1 Tax=unclassified Mycoplasma TaxID=2683645 RepID=UPI002B1E8BBA|nr:MULTISPECIES: glutamyl-tRNA amidotransferase [unclassified Mycoplasma]MEA4134323.1 glutamyl-tRNA amidotransferase [Mycoplasma sp. 2704]MEA4191139.1 glutamyl-tRNA amidotransferase [Mycoplasma sp. 2248]MEA4206254.1 glutamyl-tRNA amidotransferase [Mycoplasma sp. 1199]MEA4333642.1 glutamyl-tRNA amidotransferase [Mycoplasma sp. 1232]